WPVARRLAGPAVDDQLVGLLGDLRVEVVHEHPESGLLWPAFARQLRPPRRANAAWSGGRLALRDGHPSCLIQKDPLGLVPHPAPPTRIETHSRPDASEVPAPRTSRSARGGRGRETGSRVS